MSFTITATSAYAKPVGPVAALATTSVPTVKLLVTATGGTPGSNALLSITRIHADTSRHQVLTEQGPRLVGGLWTWLDIHCPYNQAVKYQVTADGQTATTTKPIYILSSKAFLIHPSQADYALRIEAVHNLGDIKASSRSAKFVPVGAPAVFLSDGLRDGFSGTIEFRIRQSDLSRWRSGLFKDDQILLLNTPATTGWDLSWMWMQPQDVTYTNPGGINRYPWRHISMSYTQAADPVVDLEPAWNSADALAYWTTTQGLTSADMLSRYSNCLNFETDTRV